MTIPGLPPSGRSSRPLGFVHAADVTAQPLRNLCGAESLGPQLGDLGAIRLATTESAGLGREMLFDPLPQFRRQPSGEAFPQQILGAFVG